tara:strand:+ start:582 stop:848 length:267 start_codon:yes stop_codon:yes gene_type:complete
MTKDEIILTTLHSLSNDKDAHAFTWLLDELKDYGYEFVGNKYRAERLGFPDEWDEKYGGFWIKSSYINKEWGTRLVGPGDFEEWLREL